VPRAPAMTSERRRALRYAGIYAGLAPFVLITLFPVVWMAITAFKHERDLYGMKFPLWFHLPPTLKHFDLLFTQTSFGIWALNTALVSVGAVSITLLTAVPAAYALARLRLPGAERTGIAMFMTYLVPPIVLFLPLAPVLATLGLTDSYWALVVLYPTFTIPFCTWLMVGFLRAVPRELEEAAWLDGCGLTGGLLKIVLPLCLPGIAMTAIFAFTLSMQEYLYAAVFSSPIDQKVITVGLPTMLIRGDIFFWGALMAAALLVGIPTAAAFYFVLDRFVASLTGGVDR
jgi:multiple sugar transport system permease protein